MSAAPRSDVVRRTIFVGGVATSIREIGDGPAIVLVHGGGYDNRVGVDSRDFVELMTPLAERFRVIAVDKLGAGGTAGPVRSSESTQQARVDHLRSALAELGLTDVVLVGHSRGALEALVLALDEPRVRGLVLLATATLDGGPLRLADTTTDVTPSWVRSRLVRCFDDPRSSIAECYLAEKSAWVESGEPARLGRPLTPDGVAQTLSAEQHVYLPSAEAARDRALTAVDRGELRVPVLVLWAAHDMLAPLDGGIALFRRLVEAGGDAELHVLPRGGHLAHIEHPIRAAAVITAFADRVAAPIPTDVQRMED